MPLSLSPCHLYPVITSYSIHYTKLYEKGLDVIALTDHNTALNTPAFMSACNKVGIFGIYGLEITSSEEAHVLALFKKPETAMEMGKIIYKSLLSIPNDPDKWGDQVYLDDDENILGEVDKYLTGGASIYSVITSYSIHYTKLYD